MADGALVDPLDHAGLIDHPCRHVDAEQQRLTHCLQLARGRDGLFQATEEQYELIIADRQLPHIDGLTIVQMLRKQGNKVPVLILSALGSAYDQQGQYFLIDYPRP